jgi:nitroimidazol reductase NimA-like FMN-containing flavoprotein (pyridoxamine 5'-phosphate oxidase superfamily)
MDATDALTRIELSAAAQHLLQSSTLARLAYTCKDGTPRVVPTWYCWSGEAIVMGAPPNAPKTSVIIDRPAVALTIDSDD